jgi:hypothetical protein
MKKEFPLVKLEKKEKKPENGSKTDEAATRSPQLTSG